MWKRMCLKQAGVQDVLFLRECVRNLPCECRMASLSEVCTVRQWAVVQGVLAIPHHSTSCVR